MKLFDYLGSVRSKMARRNAIRKASQTASGGQCTPGHTTARDGCIANEKPAGKKPAGKKPAGKKPAGKKPAGKKPNAFPDRYQPPNFWQDLGNRFYEDHIEPIGGFLEDVGDLF